MGSDQEYPDSGAAKPTLEAIIEASDAGILVVDNDRNFITYNQNFVDMWGIPNDVISRGDDQEALQSVLDALKRPDEFLNRVEYFYDHPTERSHDRIHLADGRIFHRYTAPVTANDTYFGRLWHFRDITDQVEREHELERYQEQLENYVDIVSHDLRNPLSVAMGRLEMADEECDSDHLDAVAEAHDRMLELIDDLLNLAKEGKTIDHQRRVNLSEVVASCWSTVDTKSATIDISTSQTICADPVRLKQLIENLLRNAVDHGGESVSIAVGDMKNGFYVEDDGPGLPEEDRAMLFESGFSTNPEGRGIGLNIVAQVAEAHDWDITVSESPSGGARFEITGTSSE
jgi:signal transduction histidine kinase